MSILSSTAVVLTAWLTGAAERPDALAGAPRADPIIGGMPTAPGEYDDVVAIQIGPYLCSATVVAPRLVLTAAHCLMPAQAGDPVIVSFGSTIDEGHIEAETWGMHPQYCHECSADIFDYGYVTLPSDFTVPGGYTLPVVDQDEWDEVMAKGHEVTLVGYGEDPSLHTLGNGIGVKRKATTTVHRISAAGLEVYAGGSNVDTCDGDSGGPAFARVSSGETRFVGITSRGQVPCGGGGYYGAPYPALCWVRNETGVDLLGPDCASCDCLDTSPPDDGGRCAVVDSHARPDGVMLLLLLAWRRRRQPA